MQVENEKQAVARIEFSRFDPVDVYLPMNWAFIPFKNRQWLHNFFTLRWLPVTDPRIADESDQTPFLQSLRILEDYVRYHSDPQTVKSPYYNTRLGDLAAGLRMPILTEYYLYLASAPTLDPNGFADRLVEHIRSEIEMMLSEEFYEKKSNHLIGLDIGSLHALLLIEQLDPDGKTAEFCEARLLKMLDGVFDSSGIFLEHSVHYQAYNAWLCTQLLDLYDRAGRQTEIALRVRQIIKATRSFLPFAIKPNGEYHLIGDTFQRPLVRYLRTFTDYSRSYLLDKVPEDETRVDQQSFPNHAMCAPEAGFAAVRFQSGQNAKTRTFHMFQSSGWHSNIHKQCDELSFSLYTGGGDLIVDPGYSDVKEIVGLNHESPWRHNTIVCPSIRWTHRSIGRPTGGGLTGWKKKQGLVAVRTVLRRIEGVLVTRILVFIQPNFLCILDHIQSKERLPFEQRFTFAPGAEVTVSDRGGFDIKREGMQTMAWVSEGLTLPQHISFDNFVIRDKGFRAEGAEIDPCLGIAFQASGEDIRLHHLICPTGRQHWDNGSFKAEVNGDDVKVSFTWNLIRFEHEFTLERVASNSPFSVHEF